MSSWNNVAYCKRQANDAYFSDTCNTVVAVPLMHKNQVMGVYNLFLEEGKTVPEDVRLLFRSISEHLGIALENARLTRENMRISLMNERQMLANQIHDSLAQTLAYAKMRLTVLSDAMRHEDYPKANRYLGDVEEAVDLAYADLRDLITQYRDRINPRGLVPAIQELAKSFRKKANADVDFLNLVQDVSLVARRGNPGLPHHPGIALQHRQARPRAPRRHHLRPGRRPVHRQRRRRRRRRAEEERRIVHHGQELRPDHHARACRPAERQAQRGVPPSRRHRHPPRLPAAQIRAHRMSLTRIILVDDHTLFRKGLAELLEQSGSIEVTAFTGKPDEVAMLLKAHRPDVLILDLNMPGTDGITLMQQLRADGFDLPVLILTLSEAEDDLARALRAGANGYLLKSMEPDEVVDAILRAQRGETVVAPAMTAKLVKLYDQKGQDATSLLDALTPREREILSHLSRGESNKAIARTLDISHDTVKLHVRHILAKLNLSSRVEAAVFAVEHRVAPGGRGEGR